jgi:ABC-type polar amino acid transport system ATPase subunit
MIKGENLNLTYPAQKSRKSVTVLKNVSFTVERGRITSFIGKSGAGKTSLLKCIAQLVTFYKGKILFKGKPLKSLTLRERASCVGFVFQQFNLFPHMTVLENCMHPLFAVFKMTKVQAEEKAREVLKQLAMENFCSAHPSQLSGGQQQRVAIARALCLNPEVLLFDEPTSALDPESTKSLQRLLHNLCEKGITIVLSSHDMPFIKSVLDRVYFLENGQIVDDFDAKKDISLTKGKIVDFLEHL